jgi:hypothetical protein
VTRPPVVPTPTSAPAEEDFALCNECGGLCCAIYLAHDEDGGYIGDGWLPDYIALWEERLIGSGALRVTPGAYESGAAGVTPLHDPRISQLPDEVGAAYRATLPAWVDTRKCSFCHPETGCLLPREFRAPICRVWICNLWETRQPSIERNEADGGNES